MLRSRRCTAPTPNGRSLRDSLRFTPEGLSDCERSLEGLEGGTKGSGVPEPPVRGNADDFWARAARFCNDAYDADTDPSGSEVRALGCQACLFCLATSHIPLNGSAVWTSVRSPVCRLAPRTLTRSGPMRLAFATMLTTQTRTRTTPR